MYKITVTLENPISGGRKAMIYQFDPATMTQAKWSGAFPAVKAELDALVADSVPPKEPPTW